MVKINTNSREYVLREARKSPQWGVFTINSKPRTFVGTPKGDVEYDAVIDPIIDRMHNANTADELHAAYVDYVHCKVNGRDHSKLRIGVCTGILQNEKQNKRFGFTDEYIMETYFNEDGFVKTKEQLAKVCLSDETKQRSEIAVQMHRIRSFTDTLGKNMNEFKNGNVDNKRAAAVGMKRAVKIINNVIADIDSTALTKEQFAEINNIKTKVKEARNIINIELPEEVSKNYENIFDDGMPFRFH